LIEDTDSLMSLLMKLGEVVEILLDLVDGQVDEHASDLRCLLFSNNLFNMLIDELTDHVLVVGVLRVNSGDEGATSKVILIDIGVGVSERSQTVNNNGLLRGNLSWDNGGSHGGNRLLVGLHGLLDWGLAAVSSTTVVLLALVHWSSHTTSSHTTLVHHETSGVDLVLNKHQDLLDELNSVRASKNWLIKWGSSCLSVIHKVNSVLSFSLLLLTDLGELVVSNIERLLVDELTMEILTSSSSLVGLLEANESSSGLTISWGNDFNAFNFTIRLELILELLSGEIGGEVLDKKIALLLWVLESGLLALNLSLSLSERKSWLNVESVSVKALAVKVINSLVSTLRSVCWITLAFIADESEGFQLSISVGLLHDDAALDVTILAKQFLELISIEGGIEVLNVDIVVNSTSLTMILWLILDDLEIIQLSSLTCIFNRFIILEANESIAIGNRRGRDVSLLNGLAIYFSLLNLSWAWYLSWLNLTKMFEHFLKFSRSDIWSTLDEHVEHGVCVLLVRTEEVSVEW
jgi:hypothetical protein